MKHLAKFTALAMVASLWSCSDDMPGNEQGGQDATGDFYTRITLQLPSSMGSRSETTDNGDPAESNNGYEFGQDYENNVNNITVILATRDGNAEPYTYKYVTSTNAIADQQSAGTPNSDASNTGTAAEPTFVMQFQSTAIEEIAKGASEADRTVYVFTICNPTSGIASTISGLSSGASINALIASIATEGNYSANPVTVEIAQSQNFLMTNAETHSCVLDTWENLLANNNTKAKAFDLGKVRVERTSCRFDFKQTQIEGVDGKNRYPIKETTSGQNKTYAYVEVQELGLFNEAKEFYLFRNASTDGMPENMVLCGKETSTNYVVGPNAQLIETYAESAAASKAVPSADLIAKYFIPLYNGENQGIPYNITFTPITTPSVDDIHESVQKPLWPNNSDLDVADYKIWRYATENPLPSINSQVQGVTTGIAFKAEILAVEENVNNDALSTALRTAMTAGDAIFAFRESDNTQSSNSNLVMTFGNATALYNYAKSHEASEIRTKFVEAAAKGIFTVTDGDGNPTTAENMFTAESVTVTVKDGLTNAELKEFDLIAYQPTVGTDGKNHYYCYYYYYNRHNNNNRPAEMGAMEFATVRNNIYKLKVDNISAFGLPTDTPPDPWTPDETPQVYFKVTCEVLDWVVRLNNIEF